VHKLAVLLERLLVEDLGEEVGRVLGGGHVRDGHDAEAAELAHLEELAVDVARVLSRVEAVAEVVGGLVVGVDLDRLINLVAQKPQQTDDVQQLTSTVGQRDELSFARRHRDAVLAARRVRNGPAGEHDDEAGRRASRSPVGVGLGAQLLGAVRVSAERGADLLGARVRMYEYNEHNESLFSGAVGAAQQINITTLFSGVCTVIRHLV